MTKSRSEEECLPASKVGRRIPASIRVKVFEVLESAQHA